MPIRGVILEDEGEVGDLLSGAERLVRKGCRPRGRPVHGQGGLIAARVWHRDTVLDKCDPGPTRRVRRAPPRRGSLFGRP